MGRACWWSPDTNPVLAVCDWLATSNNKTPRLLRKKAVEGPISSPVQGKVIGDPYAEGYRRHVERLRTERASCLIVWSPVEPV